VRVIIITVHMQIFTPLIFKCMEIFTPLEV
jgi:hypothetical protein